MTPQDAFNAMQEQTAVKIINKDYLEQWGIEDNMFTISCIYSDNVVTVVNDNGNIYSELSVKDIAIFSGETK